jgi:hypothetical protein
MRTVLISVFIFLSLTIGFAEDFIRNLPSQKMLAAVTPEKFPNMDAVIILKEQSFQIKTDEIYYRGITLRGPNIIKNKIIIVKLFNESAVKRYGSFEFQYSEYFGDEIPNGFEAHVRVLKPDGSIWVMPEDNINRIVSRESSSGEPLARKVLFKIPNLAVGDVLQIERLFNRVFSRSSSGIFFYNDRDFVLFSNLYITLPLKEDYKYVGFPEQKIGEPKVEQISRSFGAGKTLFWGLRNLNPIPNETYSLPFADRSMMTAFIVEKVGRKFIGDWNSIAKLFYENYLDEDKISDDKIKELGFTESIVDSGITFDVVDKLYASIRKSFVLDEFNSLYPLSDDINSIFKKSKGDASDLAYIMFRILRKWEQKTNAIWIRDAREGIYEKEAPSTIWFDRMGVLVNINGKEKFYDFDRSIPTKYETPWYLRSREVVVINEEGCSHKKVNIQPFIKDNIYSEIHNLKFDKDFSLQDSIVLSFSGAPAQSYRSRFYDLEEEQIKNIIKKDISKNCLANIDSVSYNNFLDEPSAKFSFKGGSLSKVEKVDIYLTFNLNNQILKSFRNKMFSTIRRSRIGFEGPFQMNLLWEIHIPEGYRLKSGHSNQSINGPLSINSTTEVEKEKDMLKIKTNILFPNAILEQSHFPKFMNFLDSTLKIINQNIIFEKI